MRRLPTQQRRTELVDAAIRVIARDGLQAATTRAIVAEAGMPHGALYYIFENREDLLRAVIEEITDTERIAAMLGADLAVTHSHNIADLIYASIDGFLQSLEVAPAREQVLLEVAVHALRHDPAAVTVQWATYRAAAADSLRHVAQAAHVEWVHPVDEVARYLIAQLDGLTLAWLTDRDGVAARRTARFIADATAGLTRPATESPDREPEQNLS